jgi:hypothetical protein
VRLYADDGTLLMTSELETDRVRNRPIGIADKVVLVIDYPGQREGRIPVFVEGRLERVP